MENQLVAQLLQIAVPVTMFTLMFAMGLTLTLADFKRVLRLPKAIMVGLLLPKSLGINTKDSVTIAVESSLKNILLAFFIATNALKVTEVAYASVIFGMIMMPVAVMIMVIYRQANKQSGQTA